MFKSIKTKIVLLGFSAGSFCYAVTSGVQHTLPGVVFLEIQNIGTANCTGAIIGDNPIKISTALHCLGDFKTGGIKIQMPGETRMIESKRAFFSQDPGLAIQLEAKTKMMAELNEIEKELEKITIEIQSTQGQDSGILGLLGGLFESDAEKAKKDKELQKTLSELVPKVKGLMARMFEKQSAFGQLSDDIATRYFREELAVITFDESLPQNFESLDQKIRSLQILPVARQTPAPGEEPVIIGGYGLRANIRFATQPDRNSYLSTNIISPSKKQKDAYIVYGYTPDGAKKHTIKAGSMGSALPGDSGGPALTPNGVAGVASLIHSYSSENPPRAGWKNEHEEGFPFEKYEYIQSLYPSTTSDNAKEILARVESEVSSVVYVDQVIDYAQVFYQEQTKIQNGLSPLELSNPFHNFLGMN